jgi:hypothetical protein
MKKLFLYLLLVLLLALNSAALAATPDAEVLGAQEKAAEKVITALTTDGNYYNSVTTALTQKLQDKVTADSLKEMRQKVAANFGTMKEIKLVAVEKFDQADRLTYLAGFIPAKGQVKLARFVFVFTKAEDKPLLTEFGVTPVEIPKPGAAAK